MTVLLNEFPDEVCCIQPVRRKLFRRHQAAVQPQRVIHLCEDALDRKCVEGHHLAESDAVRHFVTQRWIPEKEDILNLENGVFLFSAYHQNLRV